MSLASEIAETYLSMYAYRQPYNAMMHEWFSHDEWQMCSLIVAVVCSTQLYGSGISVVTQVTLKIDSFSISYRYWCYRCYDNNDDDNQMMITTTTTMITMTTPTTLTNTLNTTKRVKSLEHVYSLLKTINPYLYLYKYNNQYYIVLGQWCCCCCVCY